MKNKIVLILIVVVLLFGGLFAVTQYKNKQALSGDNPYGKENLHQETIDLLDDPLYGDIIVPEDLDATIESGEEVTVYFFSPTCVYCQKTTPVVVPITEELNIDMKKMNLLEYDLMDYYNIEGTPTIIHYKDGKEVARIVGEQPEENFRAFFEQFVLSN